jgi:hypothetical protein
MGPDADPDPSIFVIDLLLRRQQKTNLFKKSFSFCYFLKVPLYPFSKIKSQKRSHKTVEIMGFLTIYA